jgi:hypothetical protein
VMKAYKACPAEARGNMRERRREPEEALDRSSGDEGV